MKIDKFFMSKSSKIILWTKSTEFCLKIVCKKEVLNFKKVNFQILRFWKILKQFLKLSFQKLHKKRLILIEKFKFLSNQNIIQVFWPTKITSKPPHNPC